MSSPRIRAEEDRILPRILGALTRWLGSAAEAVRRPVLRFGGLPNPTGVYSTAGQWATEVRGFRGDFEAAARIGWSEAFGRETFSSTDVHVLRALDATENLLVAIPNEVHDMIRDEIARGLSQGLNQADIASRVDLILNVTGSERWPSRAQRVVTTEVTRAANAGALAAAFQAERNLGVLLKTWNDSHDDLVRETHQIANRTELVLSDPFIVGGFPMMYPADPTGPAWETVNCRCDLSFRRMSV